MNTIALPLLRMPTPPHAAPMGVPDSDALRRAALVRSWQRDRRVGRRRVVWRWTLWLLWRYGLPLAAVVAAVGALWWMRQAYVATTAAETHGATLPAAPAAAAVASAAASRATPAAPTPAAAPTATLRMDWQPTPAEAPTSPTDTRPNPQGAVTP